MRKLLAGLAGVVLLGGCAAQGGIGTLNFFPFFSPQKYACDSGHPENKAYLCYIPVDPSPNPQVKKEVNLYHRHISVVWIAPVGYEFLDDDIKLKDQSLRDQLSKMCAGEDDDENHCDLHRGRYYHLHNRNDPVGKIEYVIQIRKGNSVIPIDPILVNQG